MQGEGDRPPAVRARIAPTPAANPRGSSGSGDVDVAVIYPAPQYFPEGAASSPRLYESPKAGTRASRRSGALSAAASANGGAAAAAAGVVHNALASLNGGSRLGGGGGAPIAALAPPAPPGAVSGAGGRGGGFGRLFAAGVGGGAGGFGKHQVSYGVRTPLRKDASWFAILVLLFYVASLVFYLYVRIAFTLDMPYRGYSIFILVVEVIGMTAVLPYAALNAVHTHPTGGPGLPPDDGLTEPDKRFNVRVLLPCYKEDLGVVSATIEAIMTADLPPGVSRTLCLCDDGKDASKRAWLEENYGATGAVVYVSGRTRAKGEINGKSANLNNCLKNIIYKDLAARPADIPKEEVIVVFDADMKPRRNFFCKILEVLTDDGVALCLTPQAFSNVEKSTDIFNNSNAQFWEYILPGCDAWGYIACTGTNFCIRAQALGSVGWFPEYCIAEDYALSMELRAAGFMGRYMAEYLAVGEAPEELRNVLRQRSRWCKGHMQVFFSGRNPLFRWKLPLHLKILYNNGTWSYFATILTGWVFLLVPFLSLMFDLQPVRFGKEFALAAALYLSANYLVQNYFHVADHLRGIWMAGVSNNLLAFTYCKAIINTLLSKLHIKKKAGFKATDKKVGALPPGAAPQAFPMQAAFMSRLTSLTRRFNQATLPQLYEPQAPIKAPVKEDDACTTDKLVMAVVLNICLNTLALGLRQIYVARTITAWIALPCVWAIYNAVPPVLFFVFALGSTRTLQITAFWMQLTQMAMGLAAVVCLFFIQPPPGTYVA